MAAPRAADSGGYDDGGPAYVDDEHQSIAEFAAAFLDEDERDEFVDHLMERRGYQRVQSWGPRQDPGPDPGPDPGDGGRGGSSRTRPGSSSGGRGGAARRQGYFRR